jgi:MFS family permease
VHTASNLSSLQMSAPEEMRGRVSSFIQLYPAFISIGSLLLGPMSDWIGPRNTAWVLALVAGSIALGLFIGSPRARHLRLSHLRGAQEGLGHR